MIRLLAITGALHERVGRVVLYTAFHTNALAPDQSADPALLELPLEGEDSMAARRERPMVLRDVETLVELPGWTSPFLHVKVPKDAQGHASVDLRVGTSLG